MIDIEQSEEKKPFIPHEHVIIPNALLHPILRKHADTIKIVRLNERTFSGAALTLGIFASILLDKSFFLILGINDHQIRNAIYCTALTQFGGYPLISLEKKAAQWQKIKEELQGFLPDLKEKKATMNVLTYLYYTMLPSTYSRMATYATPRAIEKIIDREEVPFANLDCARLLRDYNVGMFDKDMNLVLIKHPDSDYNREPASKTKKIFRRIAWQQPFKRARFTLNPPQVKEKDMVPRIDAQLAALLG